MAQVNLNITSRHIKRFSHIRTSAGVKPRRGGVKFFVFESLFRDVEEVALRLAKAILVRTEGGFERRLARELSLQEQLILKVRHNIMHLLTLQLSPALERQHLETGRVRDTDVKC